ncbi:MAG: tetratricopeptide repeat protein, partial [Planctomycetes bacterium]|nr:tetratricopeptide repeat protein [Planctomycetota bacterium]
VLPVALLVLDVWPLGRLERMRAAPLARGGTARALLVLVAEKVPFFALAYLCARVTMWAKAAGDLRTLSEHSLVERAWQACYGLAFYARKMLLPSDLSPMYDLPAEIHVAEPRFLFSVVAVIALSVLLLRYKKRVPGALTVWVSYAILIAPTLGVLQTGAQLVADRYSYLACMPLALGLGGLALRVSQRGAMLQRAAVVGGAALVVFFGVATWRASALWADPIALFEHGIAASDSPRLMTNLAMTYNQAAANDTARRAEHLGQALAWSERAVSSAEAKGLLVPMYRLHRGTILLNLGRLSEAVSDLTWFVERAPWKIEGHLNLGLAYERSGQPALAAQAFERSVALAPDMELAWRGLGAASETAGDPERAIASYRRALELAPGNRAVQARLRVLEAR